MRPQTFFESRFPAPRPHSAERNGALAQLGERLICIQEVRSSILLGSTISPEVMDRTASRLDRQALSEVLLRPIGHRRVRSTGFTSYREIQINIAWFAEVTDEPLQVSLEERWLTV